MDFKYHPKHFLQQIKGITLKHGHVHASRRNLLAFLWTIKALRAHIVWLGNRLGATLKTETPTRIWAATGLVLYSSVHRAWHKLCRIGSLNFAGDTHMERLCSHGTVTWKIISQSLYKPLSVLSSIAKKDCDSTLSFSLVVLQGNLLNYLKGLWDPCIFNQSLHVGVAGGEGGGMHRAGVLLLHNSIAFVDPFVCAKTDLKFILACLFPPATSGVFFFFVLLFLDR